MKILVLGGDGMLGHQLLASLQDRHEVRVTLRQDLSVYRDHGLFTPDNSYFGVDVLHDRYLMHVLSEFQPDAVINGVGIVKQRALAKEVVPSLEINALFPHRLETLCAALNIRLIQMSTDCVFSGRKGQYTEDDISDAEDVYGKSKYLGELATPNSVTLRTSIIGLELSRKMSLIEWFLGQTGQLKGFKRAIYSGLTTLELSRLIEKILIDHPTLSGVWHVASAPISKYDLLTKLAQLLERDDIKLLAEEDFYCDRSLNGNAFAQATGYQAPSWDFMLAELAAQAKQRDKRVLQQELSLAGA